MPDYSEKIFLFFGVRFIAVPECFDDGVSGNGFKKRTEFQKMLADLQADMMAHLFEQQVELYRME